MGLRMIMKCYSVFDVKAEAYLQPFFARSHGEAIRSFESAVADEKHEFNRHAEDFSLFYVGEWDDSNASFDVTVVPMLLSKAHEVAARFKS